ncbi:MAG TPA: glycosyltransferase family 4 protein [Actinomycetota bacterium]|nr:glycosyltransferase family 4 protein [Actinomycetota bacterium]
MLNGALLTLALTLAISPLLLRALRRLELLDHPCWRSSHTQATLRGGGLAPAFAATAMLSAVPVLDRTSRAGLAVVVIGFGAVGLLEDLRGVPPLPRFALQLLAAALALPYLLTGLGGPAGWQVAFALGVAVWLVGYANAFNFMDGINGISAVQAIVAGLAWLAVGHVQRADALAGGGVVIAAAAAGFLPFNFPRARCFLGDVGSYFFGSWIAALVVVGLRSGVAPEAVLAPVILYLADTGTTLLRRVRRGEAWYLPHRDHVYQRLVRLGWSHARTTVTVGVLTAGCALLGGTGSVAPPGARAVALGGLAVATATYLALPRIVGALGPAAPVADG